MQYTFRNVDGYTVNVDADSYGAAVTEAICALNTIYDRLEERAPVFHRLVRVDAAATASAT